MTVEKQLDQIIEEIINLRVAFENSKAVPVSKDSSAKKVLKPLPPPPPLPVECAHAWVFVKGKGFSSDKWVCSLCNEKRKVVNR